MVIQKKTDKLLRQHNNKPHASGINSKTRYLCGLILVIGLSACSSSSDTDLRSYVAEIKAKQKSSIPPLPQPETFEVFTYQDASLRDPFVPRAVVLAEERGKGNGLKPDQNRERDVLEQYALGSLKLMGSLEKDGKRWALIKSADGTLHRATLGQYMGQNDGKIVRLNESQLELREIVPNGLGGWVEKMTTLSINE